MTSSNPVASNPLRSSSPERSREGIEDGVRERDAATLEIIRNSTSRLGRLAEDISAVSSAAEGRLQIDPLPLDPGMLARAAVTSAQARYAARGAHPEIDIKTHRQVLADRDRVGQVLTNLLDNALRQTSEHGTVRVRCSDDGA